MTAYNRYLKDGERVYSTGCRLIYNKELNTFKFAGIEDDTYCDGDTVQFDSDGKPFVELAE